MQLPLGLGTALHAQQWFLAIAVVCLGGQVRFQWENAGGFGVIELCTYPMIHSTGTRQGMQQHMVMWSNESWRARVGQRSHLHCQLAGSSTADVARTDEIREENSHPHS